MRIWHADLIHYLPKSQLVAQWRELNSIYKKQDNHILINYVYKYNKLCLLDYTRKTIKELENRKIVVKAYNKLKKYFSFVFDEISDEEKVTSDLIWNMLDYENYDFNLTFKEHNDRYLIQCFYNLQEKYDRGQKDFSEEQYETLKKLMVEKGLEKYIYTKGDE